MSARDELAAALTLHLDDQGYEYATDHPDTTRRMGDDLAAVAIAAGYRKPRTITDGEEMEGMHAKAVILDANGTPWVCDGDMAEPWASVCEDPFGGPIWKDGRDILLPATVLYEP